MRRPVHVVYGGAHLFKADLCRKLGDVALRSLKVYAPTPQDLAHATGMPSVIAETVYPLVMEKLQREPIEDYRIDFEDGYGYRSDAEEDAHAEQAALEASRAVKEGWLPAFAGLRIKPFSGPSHARAVRTLQIFLSQFQCPENFVVTLPKISEPAEVRELLKLLQPFGPIKIEIMMETPAALRHLREIVDAAEGRAVAVHFGPYDYTSSLGITATYQSLTHPACDFARNMMLVALADCPVGLSDGPTTLLPIAPHRGEGLNEAQLLENRTVVHNAWRLHYSNVQRALTNGFYQGWDLHPAQLPIRYAAVFAFFHEGLADASRRLRNFIDSSAQATRVGATFDDAATGEGLLNFFRRAVDCGAVRPDQLQALAGVSAGELSTLSFKF